MARITALPKGLKYLEMDGQKTLDLRTTCVDAVPRRLKGVDCILVNPRQLQYIAPDFTGKVMLGVWVIGADQNNSQLSAFDAIQDTQIAFLQGRYSEIERLSNGFFNSPHKATGVRRSHVGEETHLPADLRFSWDSQNKTGSLDARITSLTEEPQIVGVSEVLMPTEESLQALKTAEHVARKKLKHRSARSDYGFIRYMVNHHDKRG